MKILLLNTYAHGGAGIACTRLLKALQASGENAQLLTAEYLSKWPFYAERLSFLPYERDKSVRFSFSLANFGHALTRHPSVLDADILHLHWVNQGFLSLKNIQQLGNLGKPIIWTLHDMWGFTGGCHYSGACTAYLDECGNCPYLSRPSSQDLSHKIWKRKQVLYPPNIRFVTCSSWLAGVARQSKLLSNFSVTSIPNPIDLQAFNPKNEVNRKTFRTKYKIPEEALLLLFVSVKVQEERKGFRHFQQALLHLKETNPELPISLLVMGRSNPEDLAALPYPSHALGMVTEQDILVSAYSAADAYVIPSLEDNLPNTVMESLACGTPVIGFKTGGIPEMVDHLKNGYIAMQGDSVELARGISWLAEQNPAEQSVLRQAARQKVETHYANPLVAERYLAEYRKAIEALRT